MFLRFLVVSCLAVVLGAQPAFAKDDAVPRSSVGIQALIVTGVHTDVAGSQYGAGGGALFQFTIRGGSRILLHLEGIPVVSIPQRASAFYGQATPALGVLDGAVRYSVDRNKVWWLGLGTTVINQRTPLPNLHQVAESRLAGARYEVFFRRSLRGTRFIEFLAAGSPRLTGADIFDYSDGTPSVHKPEVASEEDFSLAWGVRRAQSEVLFGLRSINFSAKFTATGLAADRNNGAGVMLEVRRTFGN